MIKLKETYSKEETQILIDSHSRWFHSIDVGHGLSTPGRDCNKKLQRLHLPHDLTGWTVIDIGANDGFFSFECKERGAMRVLATDQSHWDGNVPYLGWKGLERKDHFETARKLRGSLIEDETISVYDLTVDKFGTFDLVMMFGVLYHLIHPTLGLERAVHLADKLVIIESGLHQDNDTGDIPLMLYVPDKYCGDVTNWWYPNPECIKTMMLTYGCERVDIINTESSRVVLHGYKNGFQSSEKN